MPSQYQADINTDIKSIAYDIDINVKKNIDNISLAGQKSTYMPTPISY